MTEYRTLLSNFIKKSATIGLLRNDGTVDTTDYVSTSNTEGLIKNDGTIDTTSYLSAHQDITGKEDKSNKVTNWSNTTDNNHYPTEKLVKDSLDDKTNEYDKVITSFAVQTYVTSTSGYTFENENLVTIDGGRSFTLDFSTLDDDGDYVIFKMTKTSSTGVPLVTDSENNFLHQPEIKIIKEDSTFNIYDNATNTLVGSGSVVFIANHSSDTLSMSFESKQIYHTVPLIDRIYPIGAIYLSVNSVNPSLFIGGTWVQLKDRFLLGSGDTYSAGTTGGSATVTLTKDQMPSHSHIQDSHNHTQNAHHHLPLNNGTRGFVSNVKASGIGENKVKIDSSSGYYSPTIKSTDDWYSIQYTDNTTATNQSATATNQNTGGGQAHENMPPYLTVYMWKRTG